MTRDLFFEYLLAYWDLVQKEPGGRSAPLVSKMLVAIRDSQPSIGKRPNDAQEVLLRGKRRETPYPSGYLPNERLLWVRRTTLTELEAHVSTHEGYARKFAREDSPFIEWTTAYVRNGGFATLRAARFQPLLVQLPALSVNECGAVLVGRTDAKTKKDVLWIGVADDANIGTLAISERGEQLQSRIHPLPGPPIRSWTQHADVERSLTSAGVANLRAFAREVLVASRHSDVIVGVGYDVLAPDDPEATEILWLCSDGADNREQLLTAMQTYPAADVLVHDATRSFTEVKRIVGRLVATHETLDGVRFQILDRNWFLAAVGAHPWLWAQHLVQDAAILIVQPGQDDQLRKFFTNASPDVLAHSTHSALPMYTPIDRDIRLVGNAGTGKSTTIFTVISAHREAFKICIRGNCSLDARLVGLIADDLAAQQPLVVAVDDLGWYKRLPEPLTIIGHVAQRRATRNYNIRLIVSYLTTEATAVEQNFANSLKSSEAYFLDHADRSFLYDIVWAHNHYRKLGLTDREVDAIVDFVKKTDDRPSTVVAYLGQFQENRPLIPRVETPSWYQHYKELQQHEESRDCVAFLRAVTVFDALGLITIPMTALQEVLYSEGLNRSRVAEARHRVTRMGWLDEIGPAVKTSRYNLDPIKDDLFPYSLTERIEDLRLPADMLFTFPQIALSTEAQRLLNFVEQHPTLVDRTDRLQVLERLATLYRRANMPSKALAVLERAVREFPQDREIRHGIILLLWTQGDVAAAEDHINVLLSRDDFDARDARFWEAFAASGVHIDPELQSDISRVRQGEQRTLWEKIAAFLKRYGKTAERAVTKIETYAATLPHDPYKT